MGICQSNHEELVPEQKIQPQTKPFVPKLPIVPPSEHPHVDDPSEGRPPSPTVDEGRTSSYHQACGPTAKKKQISVKEIEKLLDLEPSEDPDAGSSAVETDEALKDSKDGNTIDEQPAQATVEDLQEEVEEKEDEQNPESTKEKVEEEEEPDKDEEEAPSKDEEEAKEKEGEDEEDVPPLPVEDLDKEEDFPVDRVTSPEDLPPPASSIEHEEKRETEDTPPSENGNDSQSDSQSEQVQEESKQDSVDDNDDESELPPLVKTEADEEEDALPPPVDHDVNDLVDPEQPASLHIHEATPPGSDADEDVEEAQKLAHKVEEAHAEMKKERSEQILHGDVAPEKSSSSTAELRAKMQEQMSSEVNVDDEESEDSD